MKAMLPKNNIDKCDKCNLKLKKRDDDNEDTILERLVIYKKTSEPLFEFYKNRNVSESIEPKKGVDDYYKIKNLVFSKLNLINDKHKEYIG